MESEYKNLEQIFDNCNPETQTYRHELISDTPFQPIWVFVPNESAERKINSLRVASKIFLEFKEKLGLDHNEFSFDEKDIVSALEVSFEGEIMHIQYCMEGKRLDLCFSKYKLEIEVDEYSHVDRDHEDEKEIQKLINHRCTVIRTIPDAPDFNRCIHSWCTRLIVKKFVKH